MKPLALIATLLLLGTHIASAQCDVDIKPADQKAFNQALDNYQKGRYKEASKQMRTIAQHNPHSPHPQYWLGMMGVKNGFNTTSIKRYFPRCLELCPNYPQPLAHYYMGLIHYTNEHYEEAVGELQSYFQLSSDSDDRSVTAVYEEASNYLHWAQFLADAELHRAPFNPVAIEGVSSKHNEALPYLAPNGETIYYLRQLPSKKEVTVYSQDFEVKTWQLFSSTLVEGTFSKGESMPPPFNQGGSEGGLTLTADGRTLYYSIIYPQQGYSNCDLYRVEQKNGTWQAAQALPSPINGDRTWEAQPSISPDGSTLYFASNRKGGIGGIDIWKCRRLKNGDWSRPENLGSRINTIGNEKFPFIAADGHTLYFLSDGWQGFGGYDVYFIDLTDTLLQQPTNLGLPINSDNDEGPLGITADGQQGYYCGRLPDSPSDDILRFDLYPSAQPEPMRHCTTHILSPSSLPKNTQIRLHRSHAPDALYLIDSTNTAALMLSMREDNLLTITADNMLPEIIVIPASLVARRNPLPTNINLRPFQIGTIITLPSKGKEATLDTHLKLWLDGWIAYLLEHPRLHLDIQCPKKADAKSIYDYLIAAGLRTERFTHSGGTAIEHPQFVIK